MAYHVVAQGIQAINEKSNRVQIYAEDSCWPKHIHVGYIINKKLTPVQNNNIFSGAVTLIDKYILKG